MKKKRDQIWQREPTLARIAMLRAGDQDSRELWHWAELGPVRRAKLALEECHEFSCLAAAWFLDSSEGETLPLQQWDKIAAAFTETLSQVKVEPKSSRLSFFYAALAYGLARRGQQRGGPNFLVEALHCLAVDADLGAFQMTAPSLASSTVSTLKSSKTSKPEEQIRPVQTLNFARRWQQLRLEGFLFDVLSEAESRPESARLTPEEGWQKSAAASQITGDLTSLVALTRDPEFCSEQRDKLNLILLWSLAVPSRQWNKRLSKLPVMLQKFPSDPSLDRVGLCALKSTTAVSLSPWLRQYDWIAATLALGDIGISSEFRCLNLAALARQCQRLHYFHLRDIFQLQYRESCLAMTEGTVSDLFAVNDDTLQKKVVPRSEREKSLDLKQKWERSRLEANLTWQVLSLLGRRRLRALLHGSPLDRKLSRPEEEAVVKIIASHLGRLKGPVMKIGQTASYFGLNLSKSAADALSRLRDGAEAMPFETVTACIVRAYEKPYQEIFSHLEPEPIGVGSIGQVHRGRLLSGEEVAVKVQFPNMRAIIASDTATLRLLILLGSWLLPTTNIRDHLNELEEQLLLECDFRREAKMQERFREKFKSHGALVIPRVYEQLTRDEVLVTSFERGQRLEDFCSVATASERDRVGSILINFVVTCCRDGLFQSDNHPGNFRVNADGAIICFDFGSVKEWTPQATMLWSEMIRAGHERNFSRFQRAAVAMGASRDIKESLHRRLYEVFVGHSMKLIGEPVVEAFDHRVLHSEIKNFFSPLSSEIWKTSPDPQFIFGFRVYFGLIALISEVGARNNWFQMIREIMYEAYPSPTS